MKYKKLKPEAIAFCKRQLSSNDGEGCGRCFLHSVCTEHYLLSRDNINKHIEKFNKAFESLKENATS